MEKSIAVLESKLGVENIILANYYRKYSSLLLEMNQVEYSLDLESKAFHIMYIFLFRQNM